MVWPAAVSSQSPSVKEPATVSGGGGSSPSTVRITLPLGGFRQDEQSKCRTPWFLDPLFSQMLKSYFSNSRKKEIHPS
jgi:hypothetical protein